MRGLTLGAVVLALFLAGGATALADPISMTVEDISVNVRRPCTGSVTELTLGDFTMTLDFADQPSRGMRGTFTVDSGYLGSPLWDCMELHFIQLITSDACPATVAGSSLPFPQIDTPPNGWDYMYNDTDSSGTIEADERTAGNYSSASWSDDVQDTDPWYHTQSEETSDFDIGVEYTISDLPGYCANQGVTAFSTWLVALPTETCEEHADCLDPGEFLLLGGLDWTWASNAISISASSLTASTVNTALTNTSFSGWTAMDDGIICCDPVPEPMTLALFGLGAGVLALRRRRRRGA